MIVHPNLLKDGLKIAFLHIPKTGGKTFRQIVRNQFRDCREVNLSNVKSTKFLQDRTIDEIASLDFITGHFCYYFIPELPRRFRYFTWLRDPVERIISLYSYWTTSEEDIKVDACRLVRENNMTFDDFIHGGCPEHTYWIFSYMTQLSDIRKLKKPTPENVYEQVKEAMTNILSNFEFVGITERYNEGLKYLERTYGFNIKHDIVNVTPKKIDISDSQRKHLTRILAPEYAIYNLGKKIFEERYGV